MASEPMSAKQLEEIRKRDDFDPPYSTRMGRQAVNDRHALYLEVLRLREVERELELVRLRALTAPAPAADEALEDIPRTYDVGFQDGYEVGYLAGRDDGHAAGAAQRSREGDLLAKLERLYCAGFAVSEPEEDIPTWFLGDGEVEIEAPTLAAAIEAAPEPDSSAAAISAAGDGAGEP